MKNPGSLARLVVFPASFLLMCLNFGSEPQLGDKGILAMDGWRIRSAFAKYMFVLWERSKDGHPTQKRQSE